MTLKDRKKIAQLTRRMKAAQKRLDSLINRGSLLEERREALEEKLNRVVNLMFGSRGQKVTQARKSGLQKAAVKLRQQIKRIEEKSRKNSAAEHEAEEKVETLKDNIRRVRAGKKLGDEAPNPRGKHLAGATAKQQRQYEAILKSIKRSRRYKGREKEVAARTVRARAKNSRNRTVIKAKRNPDLTREDREKLPFKQANEISNHVGRAKLRGDDVRVHLNADQTVSIFIKGKELYRVSKAGKTTIINPRRGKRRNASAKSTLKQAGRAAKKAVRSTLVAGSKLLSSGAKALANPSRVKWSSWPTNKLIASRREYESILGKSGISKATVDHLEKRVAAINRELRRRNPKLKGKTRNAESVLTEHDKKQALQIWDHVVSQGPYKFESQFRAALDRHMKAFGHGTGSVRQQDMIYYARKTRDNQWRKASNPSPQTLRKKFAGRLGAGKTLYFPQGTPQGLAKLGRLKLIKTRRGTIKPTSKNPAGEVWLCADTNGRLHLGSTKDAPLFTGPAQDFGEVTKIEYEESKPHLGYGPTVWFHQMGEEGGRRPTLHADGRGGLKFRGGSYKIKREGIVN